jgi:hypothetical protein
MTNIERRLAHATIAALLLLPAAIGPAGAGVPLPPQAAPDDYSIDEDAVLHVDAPGLLANDHPGPASCVVSFDATGLEGEVEVQPDGSFVYRPPEDYFGDTEFTYMLQIDGGTECAGPEDSGANVIVHVSPVNDPPSARADTFQALAGRTFNVVAPGVLANDADVEGDALQAIKVNDPTHGVVSLAADGGFSYTPDDGFSGADGFSYRASDGTDTSPVRFVTITVTTIPTAAPTAPPTPTPAPTPTAEPTPTVAPSPSPSPEASASPDASAPASPGLSAASPSPAASAGPSPIDSEGGLSIPMLVIGLLVLSLLAFGGAFLVPRWLARAGPPDGIDPGEDVPPER